MRPAAEPEGSRHGGQATPRVHPNAPSIAGECIGRTIESTPLCEEIEVTHTSTLVGRTLGDVGHRGVFTVGLRREQSFQRWHEVEGPIAPGDVLVALGDGDSLVGLAAEN